MENEGLAALQHETADVLSSFVRRSQEKFSHLLEERGFTHIPPPAGFGSPTRPVSLGIFGKNGRDKENGHPLQDTWNEFPTSPLSPPSPFQHPFFRRQLCFPPPEPWCRFSGFGVPRLTPLIRKDSLKRSNSLEGHEKELGISEVKGDSNTCRYKVTTSTSRSVVRYSRLSGSYNVSSESQYYSSTFGDGVSESESDEDEEALPHTLPCGTHSLLEVSPVDPGDERLRQPSPNTENLSPHRSTYSRSYSPVSDMDIGSKRNSQAISTEPSEIDELSSVTSELDSCPDVSSPRTSLIALDNQVVVQDAEGNHLINDLEKAERQHRIALELLHTETTYVHVLHLIDQEFQFRVDQENKVHHMFSSEVIPQMFSNIKSIYKLHHDFLLPQLEQRMAQWTTNKRIGDIMKNFAPFLKMYTEYVRNFDSAMTLINTWQAKCPRFAALMDDIHSLETCGSLSLQHHMLSPVQRIPRYELLLRDYLKKLPDSSDDEDDTKRALHLVATAANHANEAMKKIDKFQKLLEVQESLGGAVELVSPTRELLKEGRIIKISARSGDHQERYLFLFNDLLLLCSSRFIGGRVMNGPQYKLRARYNVDTLHVREGDNLETANTFYICDENKSVELYTQTAEGKDSWLDALFRAIQETYQRKSSLRLQSNSSDLPSFDSDLGQKQPILIRTDSVSKCMECGSQFSVVKRKHHCRACGSVVCNKCSSQKAYLAYENRKSVRVCRTCHNALREMSSSLTLSPSPDAEDNGEALLNKDICDFSFKTRGILEVPARSDNAAIQGILLLKTHGKSWVKRWFSLHFDFVLYSFKTECDERALTATPVPGFTVSYLQGLKDQVLANLFGQPVLNGFHNGYVSLNKGAKADGGISEKDRERSFKMHHAKKIYIFQASSKDECQKWVEALAKASRAELMTPLSEH